MDFSPHAEILPPVTLSAILEDDRELPAVAPDPLREQARAFVRAAKAVSSLRAYQADWTHFEAWAEGRGVSALPATPDTVALYLTALAATHRPATITRRLTSITLAHAAAGHPTPATVRHLAVGETLKGIRRTLGTAQTAKTPLVTPDLLKVLAHLDQTLSGKRDRALLLVGYAGAFRRSELAALRVEDINWVAEGVTLTLRRSKSDQEGHGRKVALVPGKHRDTCPVRALRTWLDAAKISTGPLFREVNRGQNVGAVALHADSVGVIIKRAIAKAGYDARLFGGHSLRAGFATQAARNGATAHDIMRQTGHRSVEMVSRYIREEQIFRDAPSGKLDL